MHEDEDDDRTPEAIQPRSPCAALATAVLTVAIADAHAAGEPQRTTARAFLRGTPALRFWCAHVGLDAAAVADRFRRRFAVEQNSHGRTRVPSRRTWLLTKRIQSSSRSGGASRPQARSSRQVPGDG